MKGGKREGYDRIFRSDRIDWKDILLGDAYHPCLNEKPEPVHLDWFEPNGIQARQEWPGMTGPEMVKPKHNQ